MTPSLTVNTVGGIEDPVNIRIMDVERFILDQRLMRVSSSLMFEPSTNLYHKEGLYSEEIFGYVGSPERMVRPGYIELNTYILSPEIFKLVVQLGSIYNDIMSGRAYAVFDPVLKNFVRVTGDPLATPGAATGYSFFLRHFHEIVFATTDSSKRDDRIAVIEKYKDVALIKRYIVEPAGLRDIVNDSSGRLTQDDINKLYNSLLLCTRPIPPGSQSSLYDSIRYQIQSKAQEIYEYIENFLDGKRGFIQGSFASRKIALGTRNVITAATMIGSSPEDPQLLKSDDVQVGVYQTIKGLQPSTKHMLNTLFITPILKSDASSQIALSDPKTGKLVYTQISPATRDYWTSSDGQDKLINSFRNVDLRKKPVLLRDIEGKYYALLMVYDDGDQIAFCRSIDDLKARWPYKVDPAKLRPITYIELFYVIAETISLGKHAMITRYPVIEQGSVYAAKPHVVSTTPSRKVELIDLISGLQQRTLLRQYPCPGASYMDAMMVHPSKLGGLGGDHDGDKVSCDFVILDDANRECDEYLNSPKSILNTNLGFITGSSTYLIELNLHNMTYS